MILQCPACGETAQFSEEDRETCPLCDASWLVAGRYRLTSELGRGGMSVVYGAVDRETGDEVAVKMVRVGAAPEADWKGYELFERSSRVLQHLEHPGLPAVLAFEQDERGAFVLVRELFEGGTLEERIDAGELTPERCLALLRSLLELLDFLQSRQPPVVHRDIKPSNIMFRTADDWQPVLVDFDTVAAPEGQTAGLTLVGTPGYAAPEQLVGQTNTSTDVFSMGATMLFAATGVEPGEFEREDGKYVIGDRLDHLPRRWREVLEGMLEPSSSKRFGDAAEVLDALRPPSNERNSRLVIAGAVFGFLLVVAGSGAVVTLTFLDPPLPSSHHDLVDAALKAARENDPGAYADLVVPWERLQDECDELPDDPRFRRALTPDSTDVAEELDECEKRFTIADADVVRTTYGDEVDFGEPCPDLIVYSGAGVTLRQGELEFELQLHMVKLESDVVGVLGEPHCVALDDSGEPIQ